MRSLLTFAGCLPFLLIDTVYYTLDSMLFCAYRIACVVSILRRYLRLCDAGAMPSVGGRTSGATDEAMAASDGSFDRPSTHRFANRSGAVMEAAGVPFSASAGSATARPILADGQGEGGVGFPREIEADMGVGRSGQGRMDDRFSEGACSVISLRHVFDHCVKRWTCRVRCTWCWPYNLHWMQCGTASLDLRIDKTSYLRRCTSALCPWLCVLP